MLVLKLGFILSEEDKSTVTALEYWFRILDLDQDGVLCLYELEQFWEQQSAILEIRAGLRLSWKDIVCALCDITPSEQSWMHSFTSNFCMTSDVQWNMTKLKKCAPTIRSRILDYFVNWQKVIERESTNGHKLFLEIDEIFVVPEELIKDKRKSAMTIVIRESKTTWHRWAANEYEILTGRQKKPHQDTAQSNEFMNNMDKRREVVVGLIIDETFSNIR